MKLKISILLLLSCLGANLQAQNYVWAKPLYGSDLDQGKSIAVDGSGNVYTTGSFRGTADFDPGSGTATMTSAGTDDAFISKLDGSGNYVWAYRFGGIYPADEGKAVVTDASGNVYIAGTFNASTVDFDPGVGTATLNSANTGIFLLKLSGSGSFISVKGFTSGVGSNLFGVSSPPLAAKF